MEFFPPFHWRPLPAGNQSFLFLHKNMSVFLHLFLSSKWEVNLSSPKRNVSLVRCCVMCGFFEVGTGGQGVVKGQKSGAKSKKLDKHIYRNVDSWWFMYYSGWWFGTFFPYIGNSNPNWLIFLRGVGQPPTSILLWIWGAKNVFASLAKMSEIFAESSRTRSTISSSSTLSATSVLCSKWRWARREFETLDRVI